MEFSAGSSWPESGGGFSRSANGPEADKATVPADVAFDALAERRAYDSLQDRHCAESRPKGRLSVAFFKYQNAENGSEREKTPSLPNLAGPNQRRVETPA